MLSTPIPHHQTPSTVTQVTQVTQDPIASADPQRVSSIQLLQAITKTFTAVNNLFDIRIAVPAQFTSPRSFLEQLSANVGSVPAVHGMNAPLESTPLERMERVLTWWLASLEVFDGEQKKPFAPVVGEQFCCDFEGEGGAIRYYAEQISTHPPRSAVYFETPDRQVKVNGIVAFDGMFAGTSMRFTNMGTIYVRLERFEEEYVIHPPNFSLRGLLTGSLFADLSGNTLRVECRKTGLEANISFVSRGFMSSLVGSPNSSFKGGIYNSVAAKKQQLLRKVEGDWRGEMVSIDATSKISTILLDRSKATSPTFTPVILRDVELQSHTVWKDLSDALIRRDHSTVSSARKVVDDFEKERERTVGKGGITSNVLKAGEGGRVELVRQE
ncbi:hypothetical protein HK097_008781 [Rhizophlyctis rosea]|uniref:Oxysterol-binding protein n=1 Tax=Rhizophlyctis rosea TaxID=64517 RepID=A0AAD5SHW9_9FUNG|nr:hypothetical protein HK097_008781 [Rhizophlyctis rosea]